MRNAKLVCNMQIQSLAFERIWKLIFMAVMKLASNEYLTEHESVYV